MTGLLVDIVSWVCIVAGSIFALAGGIGVVRFPDVYTRSHAAGITDTLATVLLLGGLMFQAGFTLVTVKLAIMLLFIFFTSPTSCFALAHTAYATGLKPILHSDKILGPEKPDAAAGGDKP
jgi:multicomponent Na+:H+ antiporter subunit G